MVLAISKKLNLNLQPYFMFYQRLLLITRYNSGIQAKVLASEFKISYQTVCKIIREYKKNGVNYSIIKGFMVTFIIFLYSVA